MKLATVLFFTVVAATFLAVPALAQEEGDYRTRNSGDWNHAPNWERFNGTSWVAVAAPPTGSETITVLAADSIFVNVAVTVSGRLVNQGRVAEDGLLTIGDGGVYQHDRDEGTIPEANWSHGSTLHLTGVVATAPADRNQSYHHMIFETPNLGSNLNMNLNDVTIGGDIHVLDTGDFTRWYLTSAAPNDTSHVTIMGDVVVEAGQFAVQGTSAANSVFIVDHYGDIMVTGGNFSISRGSQPLGTTKWTLHEGNFSISNATTQNSTVTPNGAAFVFASGSAQALTLGEDVNMMALPIEVVDGTHLDMGDSELAGSGHFFLEEGSLVATSLAGGVSQIFALVVGAVTLEDESGYEFNGTSPQVTSGQMPTTVGELIIDNPAGVTLSQETLITEVLRLRAGVFDNTIPFELGPDAEISFEGGSLQNPVSTEESGELPNQLFVDQNYPNPFTHTTTVRFGLPTHSEVAVVVYNVLGQRVLIAHEGELNAGVHQISLDLRGLSSGTYLVRIRTESSEVSRQMLLMQ